MHVKCNLCKYYLQNIFIYIHVDIKAIKPFVQSPFDTTKQHKCNTIFFKFYKYILWFFLGNNATYLAVFISTLSPSMPPYTDRLAKCLLIPLFCEAACVFFLCTAVNYNVSIHPEVDMFILQLNFHICSSYVSWHNRRIFAVKRTLYWAFYLPLVKTHDFTVMNINDVYMFSVICQWPQTVHVQLPVMILYIILLLFICIQPFLIGLRSRVGYRHLYSWDGHAFFFFWINVILNRIFEY